MLNRGSLTRSNVLLITPKFDPLSKVGDDAPQVVTDGVSKITVHCRDVVRKSPSVYLIDVEWGPGWGFYDLRIDPWQPPPWESPDIWIDTPVDNDWDVYSHCDPIRNPEVPGNPVGNGDRCRPGWESRVYARVWNDGDRPATNVEVEFRVMDPPGIGQGKWIGSDTIPLLLPGEWQPAKVLWTPERPAEAHVCILVLVHYQEGELNGSNNVAQENVTDWYLEGSSPYIPVEFEFQVQNPLPHRAPFLATVHGLRPGFYVDVRPVEFELNPGEIMYGKARVRVDERVPYESIKTPPPLVSLEWCTSVGCAWRALGGISGWVHPVRRAEINAHVVPQQGTTWIKREVDLQTIVTTDLEPVRHAKINVRVSDSLGRTILITRATTDDNGIAWIPIVLPEGFPLDGEYRADVVLSPSLGIGPADTILPIQFSH